MLSYMSSMSNMPGRKTKIQLPAASSACARVSVRIKSILTALSCASFGDRLRSGNIESNRCASNCNAAAEVLGSWRNSAKIGIDCSA